MIAKLFRRAREAPPPPRVPDGRRLYAVGDVHGRLDLLDALLARIAEDERARGRPGALLFLGDVIDRGPDSAGVVARLLALAAERPDARFLLGNHEEIFLRALDGDGRALRFAHRFGGRETALSYGIDAADYDCADWDALAAMLADAVPPAHRAFLAGFGDMAVEGDYVFVHAGLRPGVALADQSPADLRWIREEFLRERGGFEKIVVHGHSVAESVVERSHRIGLDTGAYSSGVLSAMGFEGGERWIVQAHGRAEAMVD